MPPLGYLAFLALFHGVYTKRGADAAPRAPGSKGAAGGAEPPLLSVAFGDRPLHPPSPPRSTTARAGVGASAMGGEERTNALRAPPLRGGTHLRALDVAEGEDAGSAGRERGRGGSGARPRAMSRVSGSGTRAGARRRDTRQARHGVSCENNTPPPGASFLEDAHPGRPPWCVTFR